MENIMRYAKLVHKMLGILFWVFVAASVALVGVAVIGLFLLDDATVLQSSSMLLGNYKLNVGREYSVGQLDGVLWGLLISGILFGAKYCCGIRIVQGILKPMTQGRPFHREVSDGLKKLSYVVLMFGVAGLIVNIAFSFAYDNLINTTSTFPADVVESNSFWTVFDVRFLVWFFLIRLFRRIFIYGETLQQLSDETL